MSYEHLQVTHSGPIARVTLNRPERLNAMNARMVTELRDYFGALNARSQERGRHPRGAGRAFCAGLDLKEMDAADARKGVVAMFEQQHSIRDVMLAMRRCPQPVISVLQGAASGRLRAGPGQRRSAWPCRAAHERGVHPARAERMRRRRELLLPRMVGSSVAAEYLLTGQIHGCSARARIRARAAASERTTRCARNVGDGG